MSTIVSVIVPVYNSEIYLSQCIESVLLQSYSEIELILINDGSTDNSGKICDSYKKIDERVKVYHNANHGVSYSRNFGIEKAIGQYILFVDSDDFIDHDMIQKLIKLQKDSGIDFVMCSYYNDFSESPKCTEKVKIKVKIPSKSYKLLTGDILKDYCRLIPYVFFPVLKLYNRDILMKNNIRFREDMVTAEDQVFNYEYFKFSKKYKFLNEPLYIYRRDVNNSLSSKVSSKAFSSEIINIKLKREFYDKYDPYDKFNELTSHIFGIALKFYDEHKEFNYNGYLYSDTGNMSLVIKFKYFLLKNNFIWIGILLRNLKNKIKKLVKF